MPQIPVFDDRVGVSAPGAARISPEAAAAPAMALVRAGSELSNVADRYAAHEREEEEKRKRAVQQAQASEAVTAWSKGARDLEFKYGQLNDRQAANEGFGRDAAALTKSTLDAIKDPEVKAYVSREAARETLTRQDAASHSAWTNEIKYHRGRLIDDSRSDAVAAATASNDVERHVIMARREAAIDGAVSAGFVDADDGARLKAGFNSDVSEASVDHIQNAIIQRKDTGAAKRLAAALSDPKQFTDMDPLKREAKAEHAAIVANSLEAQDEARLREQQALARARIEDQYTDNVASLEETGHMVTALGAGQMRAAGFTEPQVDKMTRRMQLAGGLYQATQKTALTSPQEDAALIDSLKPSGAGFADEARTRDILGQTLVKKYKAIEQDPAAYVLSASPTIAALFQAGNAHPVQMGAAVAALNSAYNQLGVPAEARTAMPKPQAEHAVAAIMADPEHAPATMKAMAAQYGAAWPQAFADMVRLGKMPGAYQAVGVLDNERDSGTLARWLADSKGKTPDDLLGATEVSDIKKAVRGADGVQPLLQSLTRVSGSNAQAESVLDAIDTLAYAKSFYDSDPNAAVNAAKAFTDKWEFMANGGARVPKENYDAVNANAAATLSGLSLDKIAVPPVYGRQGMPKPEEFLELLKASPSWVTSPNANALWLMDTYGRLVRKKDGSPLAIPFDSKAPAPGAVPAQPGFQGLSTSPMGIE